MLDCSRLQKEVVVLVVEEREHSEANRRQRLDAQPKEPDQTAETRADFLGLDLPSSSHRHAIVLTLPMGCPAQPLLSLTWLARRLIIDEKAAAAVGHVLSLCLCPQLSSTLVRHLGSSEACACSVSR